MSNPTTDRTTGLDHVGVLYDSVPDLVESVLPWVRATLRRGGRVSAIVERQTARALRDVLGSTVDITFTPPSDVRQPRPDAFLDHLRGAAGPRESVVLAQYAVFEIPDVDLRRGEEDVNGHLADLPVTLLCACRSDARATRLGTLHATHPRLLRAGELSGNPAFRSPAEPLEVPRPGDTHVLTMPFRDTRDLRLIRTRVAAAASVLGLCDAEATAAVLTIHEAALLVCGEGTGCGAAEPPCELDLWRGTDVLTAEIRGPAVTRTAPTVPEPGVLWRDPQRVPDPLEYVRLFCREATVRDEGGRRVVRIMTPASR